MTRILRYRSGEEIKEGDRVLFHLDPGQIEKVAVDLDNPQHAWEVQEFGGGVLVREDGARNPTFISADSLPDYEDLDFVSRGAQSGDR